VGDAYEVAPRLGVSLPGVEREVAERLIEATHLVCPYSRATHGNIEVATRVGLRWTRLGPGVQLDSTCRSAHHAIQLTREGTEPGVDHVTTEQKAAIYTGVSRALFDVAKKPQEWTWAVFQEVEMENWGWGGMPVAEYRKSWLRMAARPAAASALPPSARRERYTS
jgi:4-oxalocrotonate tautomerase